MNRHLRRRNARLRRLAVALPVAVLASLWTAGLFLPSRHSEEIRAVLPASPETVWIVLTDLDGMPTWRPDLEGLERLPDGSVGAIRWLETGPGGRRQALERSEAVPPVRLVVRPAGTDQAGRRWVYRLSALERGTALTIRDERMVANPLSRALVVLFGSDRKPIEAMARDLERRLQGRRDQIAATVRR